MQTITIKLRLRDKHASELNRQARAVNFVWNYANETSKKAWTRDRRWLSSFELQKLTAGAGVALGLHSHTIKRVCAQFAISRDRARRASVRWRSRKALGWVPFNTGHVTFDGENLKFRGAHYQSMHRSSRLIPNAKIGAGSFNADSRGRWYANLTVEVGCSPNAPDKKIGLDLGLKDLATFSDGRKIGIPAFYRKSEQVLARAQRYGKTRRARAIHAKIANRRKDFLHKASSALAKECGVIVIGDIRPSKIARTRLAKSVLDAGWSDFKRMLSYKAKMHGGRYIEVNEHLSTQTCSHCGSRPDGRPRGIAGLGIREWTCSDCETVHDRDVNAAKNILRIGLDTLAEGASENVGGAATDHSCGIAGAIIF